MLGWTGVVPLAIYAPELTRSTAQHSNERSAASSCKASMCSLAPWQSSIYLLSMHGMSGVASIALLQHFFFHYVQVAAILPAHMSFVLDSITAGAGAGDAESGHVGDGGAHAHESAAWLQGMGVARRNEIVVLLCIAFID